ncbi:hypothetical protein MUN81_17990 [Hymenobacter sp. 5317J-9]|uniref:hypothetical protein n=1 Tax=Hymenobacter sp. 5317J-9 TaxID=2932250 RepID=UPI001FD66EBB|nr:hypothetical protein [Hymenobacter sp. 5317J-9]UOQ97118.1 hypothetical protein MUN81_17990 [Hymenobacter sp. 5317J-9]
MKSSKKRNYEMWAAYVWWLSLAISSTFGYLTQSGVFDKNLEKPASPVVLFFFHLMMAGFGYLVWKGYRWAKMLMLVALIYGVGAAIYNFSKGQGMVLLHSPAGNHTVVQWVLALVTATLLAFSFIRTRSDEIAPDLSIPDLPASS